MNKNELPKRRRGRGAAMTSEERELRAQWSALFQKLMKRDSSLTSSRVAAEVVSQLEPTGLSHHVKKMTVDKWRSPTFTLVPTKDELAALAGILETAGVFSSSDERDSFSTLLNFSASEVVKDTLMHQVVRLLGQLSEACEVSQEVLGELKRLPHDQLMYVLSSLMTQHARSLEIEEMPERVVVLRKYSLRWDPGMRSQELDALSSPGFVAYLQVMAGKVPSCQFRTVVATDTEDAKVEVERSTQFLRRRLQAVGGDSDPNRSDLLCLGPDNAMRGLLDAPHKAVWLHFLGNHLVQGWSMSELFVGAPMKDPKLFTTVIPLSRSDRSYYRMALAPSVIQHDGAEWQLVQ